MPGVAHVQGLIKCPTYFAYRVATYFAFLEMENINKQFFLFTTDEKQIEHNICNNNNTLLTQQTTHLSCWSCFCRIDCNHFTKSIMILCNKHRTTVMDIVLFRH